MVQMQMRGGMMCLCLALAFYITESHASGGVIQMAPSQAELLHLERPAGAVIVGNPAHVTAILDQPQLLVLIPGAMGATNLTILDQEGQILLSRQVIVNAKRAGHVTVHRACNGGQGEACRPQVVLNCAHGCVEVRDLTDQSSPAQSSTVSAPAAQQSADYGQPLPDQESLP